MQCSGVKGRAGGGWAGIEPEPVCLVVGFTGVGVGGRVLHWRWVAVHPPCSCCSAADMRSPAAGQQQLWGQVVATNLQLINCIAPRLSFERQRIP